MADCCRVFLVCSVAAYVPDEILEAILM